MAVLIVKFWADTVKRLWPKSYPHVPSLFKCTFLVICSHFCAINTNIFLKDFHLFITLPLNSPADKLNCLSHLLVDGYQLSCSCIPSRNLTREYSWWIFCHIWCRCSRCCLGMVHMWERGMTLSYSFSGIPGMYGVPSTNRTTLQTQTPLSSYCTLMKHNTNAIHNMTSASQEEKKREGKKRLKRRIHSCTREREGAA